MKTNFKLPSGNSSHDNESKCSIFGKLHVNQDQTLLQLYVQQKLHAKIHRGVKRFFKSSIENTVMP